MLQLLTSNVQEQSVSHALGKRGSFCFQAQASKLKAKVSHYSWAHNVSFQNISQPKWCKINVLLDLPINNCQTVKLRASKYKSNLFVDFTALFQSSDARKKKKALKRQLKHATPHFQAKHPFLHTHCIAHVTTTLCIEMKLNCHSTFLTYHSNKIKYNLPSLSFKLMTNDRELSSLSLA